MATGAQNRGRRFWLAQHRPGQHGRRDDLAAVGGVGHGVVGVDTRLEADERRVHEAAATELSTPPLRPMAARLALEVEAF